MAEREGLTEKLKEANQMEWDGKMNNIRNRLIEIINVKLIFQWCTNPFYPRYRRYRKVKSQIKNTSYHLIVALFLTGRFILCGWQARG